ncbi:MAG: DUF503 domain-containing protein [Actinomycetia bacterium]|nr:DUF503 domain-containing protein [Actinomycetes bacterium]
MYVLTYEVHLHLPECRSLKAKRGVLRPIIEGIRRRFQVAVAEVDHQDTWQRTAIGVAIVSASPSHCEEVIDEVERFVWSVPDIQVLESHRQWMEEN